MSKKSRTKTFDPDEHSDALAYSSAWALDAIEDFRVRNWSNPARRPSKTEFVAHALGYSTYMFEERYGKSLPELTYAP